jgi:uncharacterized protein YoxC
MLIIMVIIIIIIIIIIIMIIMIIIIIIIIISLNNIKNSIYKSSAAQRPMLMQSQTKGQTKRTRTPKQRQKLLPRSNKKRKNLRIAYITTGQINVLIINNYEHLIKYV